VTHGTTEGTGSNTLPWRHGSPGTVYLWFTILVIWLRIVNLRRLTGIQFQAVKLNEISSTNFRLP